MKKVRGVLRRAWKQLRLAFPTALPVLIFAITAAILIVSIKNAGGASSDEELRVAEDGIRRAAVSCYAVEGQYPESYEYLRDNYGVRVNEEKFAVMYEIFASNIMPDITVIAR